MDTNPSNPSKQNLRTVSSQDSVEGLKQAATTTNRQVTSPLDAVHEDDIHVELQDGNSEGDNGHDLQRQLTAKNQPQS